MNKHESKRKILKSEELDEESDIEMKDDDDDDDDSTFEKKHAKDSDDMSDDEL